MFVYKLCVKKDLEIGWTNWSTIFKGGSNMSPGHDLVSLITGVICQPMRNRKLHLSPDISSFILLQSKQLMVLYF